MSAYHEFLEEVEKDSELLALEKPGWSIAVKKLIALCRTLEEQRDFNLAEIMKTYIPEKEIKGAMPEVNGPSNAKLDEIVSRNV